MIELSHIDKIYRKGEPGENQLFSDFNLTVKDGEFVSVIGSNGSGKTSMLNLICGSIFPTRGQILLDGKDITGLPEYKRYQMIGRVYQDPGMGNCGNLTILENLCLTDNKGKPFDFSRGVDRRKTDGYRELLAQLGLGLEDRLESQVGMLSGGQRQSLSLLMATMRPIQILILDEHTAALDPKTAETVMVMTDRIVKEKHLTAVMVTHNLRYAVEYGNRILMMHKGNAVIDKAGEEKASLTVPDLLTVFNEISIECGN